MNFEMGKYCFELDQTLIQDNYFSKEKHYLLQ